MKYVLLAVLCFLLAGSTDNLITATILATTGLALGLYSTRFPIR